MDGQLTPQPDLDDVDRLASQLRETGLELSLTRSGEVRRLGPGVELAAYRILQEALTNVLKHGHARRAEVEIEYGDDRLVLSVRDDGTGGPSVVTGSGNGLRGMSERAALYGGTLQAGPRPGGGYAVRAELPVVPGLMTIRVAVVDDQALVRGGFSMILEAEPDIEVVGEAGDGAEAVELCARVDPDVVLMDVRMPVHGRRPGHPPG